MLKMVCMLIIYIVCICNNKEFFINKYSMDIYLINYYFFVYYVVNYYKLCICIKYICVKSVLVYRNIK